MSAAEGHIYFLRFIIKANRKQQRWLLNNISNDQSNAIGEVCYNILFGDRNVSQLRKHQRIIRVIADKGVTSIKRRRLIGQHHRVVLDAIAIALE